MREAPLAGRLWVRLGVQGDFPPCLTGFWYKTHSELRIVLDKPCAGGYPCSMTQYVVAHCRKLKTPAGLRNVVAHNSRKAVYDHDLHPLLSMPDYIKHPELRKHNEGDRPDAEAVFKRRSDRMKDAELLRKPKKDAATAIEVVISASPEWFAKQTPKDVKAYFADARKALTDRFGAENLLQWNTHWDETSPHMHVLFVPIMATEKGNKYTSSEFLGGRNGLREFQDFMYFRVGKKHGLERGQEGSKARHKDQYDWARETKAEADRLKDTARELEAERRQLERETEKLKETEFEVNCKMKALSEREQEKVMNKARDKYFGRD